MVLPHTAVTQMAALYDIQGEIERAEEDGHDVTARRLKGVLKEMAKQDGAGPRASVASRIRVLDDSDDESLDETQVYLAKCRDLKIPPKPTVLTMRKQVDEFRMPQQGAGDKNVEALASAIRQMKGMRIVDLSDNRIGEVGCVRLAGALRGHTDVQELLLGGNRIERGGAAAMAAALPGMTALVRLDLARCHLGDAGIKILFPGLTECHRLTFLNLMHNQISSAGGEEIGEGMNRCQSLADLDLSWNAVRGKGSAAIGESLKSNRKMVSLNLSWNAVGADGGFDDWAGFFEENATLKKLNLAHSSMDERAALILAENIRLNDTIEWLNLDNNPLGPLGAQVMFKLMDVMGESRHITFENCNFHIKSKNCTFDPQEPQGSYELDLAKPYDRTIAMHLVRVAGDNIMEQLKSAKLDRRPYDVGQLKKKPRDVPYHGWFETVFAKFSKRGNMGEIVTDKTFQRLRGMVCGEEKNDRERQTIVKGFAMNMHLASDQISSLMDDMEGSSVRITMLSQLFSRIVDRDRFDRIEAKLHASELIMLRKELGALYHYSDDNPTNHYKLNLSRTYDRQLANKILELNNDERQERKHLGLSDTSDQGFFMNFRNETIDGRKFVWNGTWTLPAVGFLEFDYVSTTRPSFDSNPMSDDKVGCLLDCLIDCLFGRGHFGRPPRPPRAG